jgi:hypothetical protein
MATTAAVVAAKANTTLATGEAVCFSRITF